MKKIMAWLLVMTLTVAISIGATLAYLTDTDEDVNVMTLGKVKIDQLEYERVDDETQNEDAEVQEFHDNKPLLPAVTDEKFDYTPGDPYVDWEQIGKDGYTSEIWDPAKINNELDKMVFIKNKGDYDAYVRSVFAFEAGKYATLDQFKKMVHLNLNETDYTWEWSETPVTIGDSTYFVATATYNNILAPSALTEISLSQIALDKTATNEDVEAFGETYQILVKSQGIQASGFEGPDTALDEGFGLDIPWENDTPTQGVMLFNALHYVDGDVTSSSITANVKTVTFGLNEEYDHITSNYEGTLVDDGQDVPVYAYYVNDGGKYDVYFLANDQIYLPADSYQLFYNGGAMTSLTSVYTENLNTSRVVNMARMFRGCSALKDLDVSGFDTSSVTATDHMFYQCSSLTALDVSGWDVSNVTNFWRMFYKCGKLSRIDGLSNWNPKNVTDMRSMFYQCKALTDVGDLSNWDMSKVTNMQWMFYECSGLKTLKANNWDVRNVTSMSETFLGCTQLETVESANWNTASVTDMTNLFMNCHALQSVDVSDWDVSKVSSFYGSFYNCYALTTLDASDWNTGSATNMAYMFNNCHSLETVDVSNWDVSKVQTFYTFAYTCKSLTELDVTNWDTGSANNMSFMFADCVNLAVLDPSGFNVTNVTDMASMFKGCLKLKSLDLGGWNVSKVKNMRSMFAGVGSNAMDMTLESVNLADWNPVSVTDLSYMFYGCAKLTELDLGGWNMAGLKTASHMFADCISLVSIDLSDWNTANLTSMDAMFNDCRSLPTVDVSSLDTAKVLEFSQTFEACWNLTHIIGLEYWDTTSAATFDQMFLSCGALQELNLSSFSTYTARDSYYAQNNSYSNAFTNMFGGVKSLQKLTLGKDFCFTGNGSVAEANQVKLPSPVAIDGVATKWYNAENGVYYAASEVPEKTAATYVAAIPGATGE